MTESKKPTIQDIARRAGVSRATVSRVLNDFDYVSDDKRERVIRAMQDLGYRPSFSARHMRTQRSRLIGFLESEVATTPFAGEIIKGAQDAAWEHDYILLVLGAGDLERTRRAVDTLLEREVEGIIFAAIYHHQVQLPSNIYEITTVLANCYSKERNLPSVVPDEVKGGYEATRTLLEEGHRRVGFINIVPAPFDTPASIGRLEGYKQALAEYSIPFDGQLVGDGYGQQEDGYRAGLELMNLSDPPTAIFCGTDRAAMGTYDALRDLSLRVPDDVAIVGFDNQATLADGLRPPLTTMQLPHYEMGRWAMDYLINRTQDGTEDPLQHMLECPPIMRQSHKTG